MSNDNGVSTQPERRPVPGAGDYEIDTAGVVYSRRTGKPMYTKVNNGHCRVRLRADGLDKQLYVARLVLTVFQGAGPPGAGVRYRDFDRANCALENLEWKVANISVPPEEFIRAWQTSCAVAEVCQKTGMVAYAVYARAANYKRKGVPLKRMPPGRRRIDYGALAELAQSLVEKTQGG